MNESVQERHNRKLDILKANRTIDRLKEVKKEAIKRADEIKPPVLVPIDLEIDQQ